MGLSALPSPSEGVLVLLVNAALSLSLFKGVLRSLLHVVGRLHRAPSAGGGADGDGESLGDRFRSRVKQVRFGNGEGHPAGDCRVCLTRFQPDSVVNRLRCGHLFHEACLGRWLDYHHVTCPLCRTLVLPAADEFSSSSWPWR